MLMRISKSLPILIQFAFFPYAAYVASVILTFVNTTLVDTARALLTEGWLASRVVSVLDSGAEGPGSNRSRDAVG